VEQEQPPSLPHTISPGLGRGNWWGRGFPGRESPCGAVLALPALSQPRFALTLVCKSPGALTGGTGGWKGREVGKESFSPQKGFPLGQAWADPRHPCPCTVPGSAMSMGLGWWYRGVQSPHLDVSPAGHRQERRGLESTTLHVVRGISGTSSHASTKALGAHHRVLSVSRCRLDTASFSITHLRGGQVHHSISCPSVVGRDVLSQRWVVSGVGRGPARCSPGLGKRPLTLPLSFKQP